MRKIILLIAGIILVVSGYSQVTSDIGIWGGVSGYMGDIEGKTLTQSPSPVFGAFFRYNFHQRVSARLMFLSGKVWAEGPIQNYTWRFPPETGSKGVQDLTLQAEINYLKYKLGSKKTPFTSYLTAGLGVMYYQYTYDAARLGQVNSAHLPAQKGSSVIAPSFPFGIGFKVNIGKRIGVGIEYQMRKIFDDRLDDLDDPLAHLNNEGEKITYTDFFHNNDWTGFLGLHITYTIYMGNKACPAYDTK
jgi:Domain of unknown function (DUF6089)